MQSTEGRLGLGLGLGLVRVRIRVRIRVSGPRWIASSAHRFARVLCFVFCVLCFVFCVLFLCLSYFLGSHFCPDRLAKMRHVTISMHVHVTHFDSLLCFRSSGLGSKRSVFAS